MPRKAVRAASFDSDESDDSDDTTRQPTRKQATKSRRGVIQDDDSDEEEEEALEGDEDDEVDDDDDEEEEAAGAEDSDDEADMTVIEETLPVAKSSRKTRAKSGEVENLQPLEQPRTPVVTPKKSSSSEADQRFRDTLPKTPSEQKVPPSSQLLERSSTRPMMTPHTPRMGAYSTIPASQARSTIAPSMPVPPKVRLVIHKMVLRDFKSYAGEQIIGPFHKSFSAVVGPNGSGKSNVIDAMLFVFGWRANKMRQGKLSELIHNSAGRDNLPNCSVEVWFREIVDLPGPDDFEVVPNSRLIVARTAYRNNSSVYTMNGKKSNFTEVTTLLKTRGIDLDHKRFLILQGEVESIAQMPPKAKNEHEEGLLEYLEDIIGTSSYKTPIEEANKKVDEANELRGERLARLKIVQKEKDSLEPKKREAETYLRDQNELTQRQSALWQVYMMECRDEMTIASTSMEKLKNTIAEEREKNAGSKAEVDSLEKEFKKISAEYDAIVKETDKVVKDLAKYEKEDVQMQEKRKRLETKKKKLTKSMADDKHASSEARSTLANSTEEIETLEKEVKSLEASLEKQEAELDRIRDSLKGKTEQFSIAIEQKQVELQPWVAKISEKKNAREVAIEEKRLLSERFSQMAKEADQAQKALSDLTESSEAKREEVKRLQAEKIQQMEKAKTYEEEIKEMEKQEQDLRAKASASRSKCEDAKASMQSNRSRGDVLNSLTRQAELGMIRGFHGRLGNLGVIDDKYDVAISTACPGLDNIVVDGVEHGQACIEHLRKNNLGRGNFVLLNSLAKMNMAPIQTPDNVPRLFDLVKPRDARFAPAFYHQLRDTLVARDLAHANKIAYGAQRWRVVTLDGQLIDKSGTMSGGGTKVARGAMSSKALAQEVSLEQLSKLDKERQVNEDSLQSHIKYTKDMKSRLEACKQEVPKMEMSIEKIEMDLNNSRKMIQEAQKRIKELQQQGGPDDADQDRIKDLEGQVSALDDEIKDLSRTSSKIETDIAALQEKILEAGGVELRAQNSKVDGIKERIELFGERMTKAEVAKTKAEKDLVKLTKSTDKNTEALSGLESELQEVIESIGSSSQSVDAVRQKLQDSQDDMEAKKEVKDEIKEKLDQLLEGANAFRSLEMEIKQKLEENEKSLKDNEKRFDHWQEKHSKLVLQQIDSDDDEVAVEEANKTVDKVAESGEEVTEEQTESRIEEENVDETAREVSLIDNKSGSNELQEYSPDELRSINKESIKAEIVVYEEKLQKGQGNLSVLQEYKKRELEFLARAKDLEQTTQERDEAKQRYDDLRKQRLESFMAGFAIISSKLKEMYQTITLGGNAELELVDSLDPFSEGILFSVMPPKKSWKNISNLSGGEKTLSSLALVFALHAFKPTPLYAMDELDAALDFRNVSIVANLIKERTKGAQFIVISLRNNMFELASRLVGIYKTNGQTKSLAVHNSDLHALPPPTIPPPSTISRQSTLLTTPRPSVPRGSMPVSMTTPSLHVPPSTLRKPPTALSSAMTTTSRLDSLLASPAPHSFSQIPQTPKTTGLIRGLGVYGSSVKLTSSQSIRGGDFLNRGGVGDFAPKQSSMLATTPLAVRRRN
jgi:structural maintenance of chromosome 4